MSEETSTVYRYIYLVEHVDNAAWYLGSRTSSLPPKLDLGQKYFTSSSDSSFRDDFKNHPERYRLTILEEGFLTDIDLRAQEQVLIAERWNINGRINRSAYPVIFENDDEWRRNIAEANRKLAKDPEWRRNSAEANRKRSQDPEWRQKNAEASKKYWAQRRAQQNEDSSTLF